MVRPTWAQKDESKSAQSCMAASRSPSPHFGSAAVPRPIPLRASCFAVSVVRGPSRSPSPRFERVAIPTSPRAHVGSSHFVWESPNTSVCLVQPVDASSRTSPTRQASPVRRDLAASLAAPSARRAVTPRTRQLSAPFGSPRPSSPIQASPRTSLPTWGQVQRPVSPPPQRSASPRASFQLASAVASVPACASPRTSLPTWAEALRASPRAQRSASPSGHLASHRASVPGWAAHRDDLLTPRPQSAQRQTSPQRPLSPRPPSMASTPPGSPHTAGGRTLMESFKFPYFAFTPADLDSPRTPNPTFPWTSSKLAGASPSGVTSSTASPNLTYRVLSVDGSSVVTSASDDLLNSRGSVAFSQGHGGLEDQILPLHMTSHFGPIMQRQVNPETGDAQTVVTDETGHTSTYSQDTVSSALTGAFRSARVLPNGSRRSAVKKSTITRDEYGHIKAIDGESMSAFFDEAIMRKWIASLRKCHLKGFDQEVRFRLSSMWTEYSKMKTDHEDYLENADYIFFGLDKDTATLKDLEKAFHRLAKLMHPDKNGGSAEAKIRFQEMKERYESLKRKIRARAGKVSKTDEDQEQKELLDEGQEYNDNSDDDESQDSGATDSTEPEHEPDLDRDEIEAGIWKLLDTAKAMQRQMKKWKEQLESVSQAT